MATGAVIITDGEEGAVTITDGTEVAVTGVTKASLHPPSGDTLTASNANGSRLAGAAGLVVIEIR
jgi:hypothetical protein